MSGLSVPKVLQALINRYNEIGCFVLCSEKIYWFNGKRKEFWCDKPSFTHDVIDWNGKYSLIDYVSCFTFSLFDRKFTKENITPIVNKTFCFYKNDMYYLKDSLNLVKIQKDGTYTIFDRQKDVLCGCIAFGYNNFIYILSNIQNEKFDLSSKKWSYFKMRGKSITKGCLVNSRYYMANMTDYYDVLLDEWKTNDCK